MSGNKALGYNIAIGKSAQGNMTDTETGKSKYESTNNHDKGIRQSNSAMNPRKVTAEGEGSSAVGYVAGMDQGPYLKATSVKKKNLSQVAEFDRDQGQSCQQYCLGALVDLETQVRLKPSCKQCRPNPGHPLPRCSL